MPGLIGFVKRDPPGGAAEFVKAMAQALEPHDAYHVDLFHADDTGLGRVSLGLMNPETQPIWNAEKTRCIFMEGELYDTEPLRQDLAKRNRQLEANNDADLALHLYEEYGEEFPARLNGAFIIAIWDLRARRLLLANDRLGLFPLYYARVNDGLLFGSGVRALMADPALSRSVDLVAINEFMIFNHVLDDRTLLDAARLLPQASILTFQDGRLKIRPYWTLRYPLLYRPRSEAEYAEGLLHHLRLAVKRQQPGNRPAGMLLSGGLDSRILLALLYEGLVSGTFHTFTWGIPGCDDARYAEEVAAKVGAQHHFFELKPDWLLHLGERAVQLTDGLGCVTNLHALATLNEEARHAHVLYKGFLGDAMLGFAVRRQMWADYAPEDSWRVHLGVYEEQDVLTFKPAEEDKVYTPSFRRQVGDAVYESLRAGMARSGVAQLANQRLYFDLTQRVPRMTINGVEVVRSRCVVRLPFAENDLLDFVLTVPPGFLFDRYLARLVMSQKYPELAKLPMTPSNLPMISCARNLLLQGRQFAAWHLRKAGLGRLAGRGPRPYKDYGNWFRGVLRSWVEGILLNPRALERGYFNAGFIRQLVAEHMAGEDHALQLGSFLTLELWHRQFID